MAVQKFKMKKASDWSKRKRDKNNALFRRKCRERKNAFR